MNLQERFEYGMSEVIADGRFIKGEFQELLYRLRTAIASIGKRKMSAPLTTDTFMAGELHETSSPEST